MQIFTCLTQKYRWYYTTPKNIKNKLSTPPYRKDDKIYALCPYCFNPVQIILKKHDDTNSGDYYAKHIKSSPFLNISIDRNRLNHCILRKQPRLLTKSVLPAEIDIDALDINQVRKALFILLHVSMSQGFVKTLLKQTKDACLYTYCDEYNYPFMMILEMRYLLINNRRLSNFPQLLEAISTNCKYFKLTSEHRVISNNEQAKLYFIFENQGISQYSKLNFLNVKVIEENKFTDYNAQIYQFKIYIKSFANLFI